MDAASLCNRAGADAAYCLDKWTQFRTLSPSRARKAQFLFRSDAAKTRKPRQDRKVATVSGHFWVTPVRLKRASEFAHDNLRVQWFVIRFAQTSRIRVSCSRCRLRFVQNSVREFYVTHEVRLCLTASRACAR